MKSNREKHCWDEIHRILHMKLIPNQSPSSMQPRSILQWLILIPYLNRITLTMRIYKKNIDYILEFYFNFSTTVNFSSFGSWRIQIEPQKSNNGGK